MSRASSCTAATMPARTSLPASRIRIVSSAKNRSVSVVPPTMASDVPSRRSTSGRSPTTPLWAKARLSMRNGWVLARETTPVLA